MNASHWAKRPGRTDDQVDRLDRQVSDRQYQVGWLEAIP